MVDAPNEGKMLSRAYRFESCPDYTDCDVGCVSNITKQYDGSEKTSKNSQMTEYRR